MPTNRKRLSRRPMIIMLDETIREFLLTGEKPERETPAWDLYVSRHFKNDVDQIGNAWLQHRDSLLPDFIKKSPCTRPWAFWMFEVSDRDEYESEAAYLKRKGLLTGPEIVFLLRKPSLLRPLPSQN